MKAPARFDRAVRMYDFWGNRPCRRGSAVKVRRSVISRRSRGWNPRPESRHSTMFCAFGSPQFTISLGEAAKVGAGAAVPRPAASVSATMHRFMSVPHQRWQGDTAQRDQAYPVRQIYRAAGDHKGLTHTRCVARHCQGAHRPTGCGIVGENLPANRGP